MRFLRRSEAQSVDNVQRAVIAQQKALLRERDEQIQALEVELEATRALVNVDHDGLVATYCQLARVYRAQRDFARSHVQFALELLEVNHVGKTL